MKIKSLCFKWGDTWVIFCSKCGMSTRMEAQYNAFYKLLDIKPPELGKTSLETLVRHLNNCKGDPTKGFSIASMHGYLTKLKDYRKEYKR